ncbi:MAG: DegT/DnrJ/EryC1/StrS family aminotransferase [Myxococcota bacterium]
MRTHEKVVRLGRPVIDRDDLRSLIAVLATGQLVQGRVVDAFERKLEGLLGAKHALAVSSGTAALHLALKALGIGRGDDVIVPAFTFPATANVVEWLGARPVFCDVAPQSFNAGPEEVARAMTRKTRAVIPVHAFGVPADVPAIAAAASGASLRRKRPLIVEDAACALGASLRGEPAGTMGDAGCFSFHPRKIMTTGEGGLLVTPDDAVSERVRALRSHGLVRTTGGLRMTEPGLNYRMTDVAAALGVGQLSRLEAILARRARLAGSYREALGRLGDLFMPPGPSDAVVAHQSFVVMFRTQSVRRRVQDALLASGIETGFGTYCVPMLDWYRRRYGLRKSMFPHAWAAQERSLALPLHPALSAGDQGRVVRCLRRALT